jgi:hypothetical protein
MLRKPLATAITTAICGALFALVFPALVGAQETAVVAEPHGRVEVQDRVRAILRTTIARCWRAPTDAAAQSTRVTLNFELNLDGTLVAPPVIAEPTGSLTDGEREAVENALRAVRLCQPFAFAQDPVLRDNYEVWRRLSMSFVAP